ncbi:MAG: dipeptidase [Planctomycetes bacterium]|nr:dipeptidase [Planctomycetota bacterium]
MTRFPLSFFLLACLLLSPTRAHAQSPEDLALYERVQRILKEVPLIDGHNDTPGAYLRHVNNHVDDLDLYDTTELKMHTDIPRLRKGGVGGQFWSVYIPIREPGGAAGDVRKVIRQIDITKRMIEKYPDVFELALTADDVERIHRDGRIASMLGMEGGHSIENSLASLRALYDLGARYMTLTHSDTLDWADSATDEERHGGLTPFGTEVVREMNRLGMLVDLSHVSVPTMKQAIRTSRAPIIFSHSSARAIADHPRNVPDDVLRMTAENGGVVMVNFYSGFVVPEAAERGKRGIPFYRELKEKYGRDSERIRAEMRRWYAKYPVPPGTVHVVLDHIEHIAKVAGVDHVGLGSDYDGIGTVPIQLEDVSKYPNITQGLLDRGFSEQDIKKILGGNLLRAMREAENVARRLRQEHDGGA